MRLEEPASGILKMLSADVFNISGEPTNELQTRAKTLEVNVELESECT